MSTINYSKLSNNNGCVSELVIKTCPGDLEPGIFEVDGTGKLEIRNTGGSSAAEGGMGDRGGSEKGAGITQTDGETKTNDTGSESFDKTFDPLAPKEEKSKENS